jgi:ABC-type uncharacterized transport system fused permease/ATPase subunit
VKAIDLVIRPGENLLVTGANGAGTTSLFRCLAGLWEPTSGRIVRPASALAADGHVPVFYVPQRPYLVSGTLRDQVRFVGDAESPLGDAESSLGDAESSLGDTLRARWVTLRARWVTLRARWVTR